MERQRGWLQTTTRWGQVNLNESDVTTFDPAFWMDFWKRSAIQGVTLNAGGVVAYYPTKVAHHRRAAHVDNRDVFGEMVEAAKSIGLRVLGRLDLSVGTAELHAAHPDWFQTNLNGEPLTRANTHNTPFDPTRAAALALGPRYYRICPTGPYGAEFAAPIVEEILASYDIDGFFANGWPLIGQGIPSPATVCHCPHCRTAWGVRHGDGADLPHTVGDPRWRSYVDMLQGAVEDGQSLLASRTAALKPGATFLPVVFPVPATGLRWRHWSEVIDAVCADAQTRRTLGSPTTGPAAMWEPGLQAEMLRSVAGDKPIIRFCGTYSNPPLMRQSAKPPLETRLLMAQSLAHGERPKWHTVGGHSYDRRWMDPVAEYGNWTADHEPELRNVTSIADVAILWSQQSSWSEQWDDPDTRPAPIPVADAMTGWYAALLVARIPAEIIHEDHLEARLHHYRVLIIPSGTALTNDAIDAIRAFHRAGGAVIGCCGASLCDESGVPREDLGLADVFATQPISTITGPHPHSYLRLHSEHSRHPVLAGFEETDIVAGGRWMTKTAATTDAASLTTWIPDYPVIPTNEVVMGEARKDVATVIVRSTHARSAYLAMDLDAEYRRTESPDHRRLLANITRWAIGSSPSIEVDGAGVLDVRIWRQRSSMTVHLVNLDTPQLSGGPVADLRPLGTQTVTVAMPDSARPAGARLLRAGRPARWTPIEHGQRVRVTVPSINDFEVVAIDLG
jgi:hypothetical protein